MQLKVAFQPSEKNWIKICINNVLLVEIQGTQYTKNWSRAEVFSGQQNSLLSLSDPISQIAVSTSS